MDDDNERRPSLIRSNRGIRWTLLMCGGLMCGLAILGTVLYVVLASKANLEQALTIISHMNESVPPCENFYEFVCGKFNYNDTDDSKAFKVVKDRSFFETYRFLLMAISDIKPATEKSKPRKLVKELYNMCMDQAAIEAKKADSLMAILNKWNGWPVLLGDHWNEAGFSWEKHFSEASKIGLPMDSFFLKISFMPDHYNSSILIFKVDQPMLEFPGYRMLAGFEDEAVKGYYDFMVNVAVALGADKIRAERDMSEVLKLEIKLTEISPSLDSQRRNWLHYNISNLAELRETWPSIDWDTLFDMSYFGVEVEDTDPIVIQNVTFVNLVDDLLKKTPKRVQANYQFWKVVEFAIPYLNIDLRKIRSNYTMTRTSASLPAIDWSGCVDDVRRALPHITDAMFIQENFKKSTRAEVLALVDELKKVLKQILNRIPWLDERTRNYAIEKATAINALIAYPDEALDNKRLEDLYKNYELVKGDYFLTMLNFKVLERRKTMSFYKNSYNITGYEVLPSWLDVNAYNVANKNTIMILAGYLHDEFYNKHRPTYVNYGIIGAAIGHELSHSFDDRGTNYNKYGNYDEWLSEPAKKVYREKVQCLIDQYSNYTIGKINKTVDAMLTLGENIADNNGVRLTYMAYQDWVKTHGPEPNLSGIHYTPNQMYWISFAHAQCKEYKEKDLLEYIYDPHPPNDIRVTGSVSNSPEFAADFECPDNAKMNRKHKCTFW